MYDCARKEAVMTAVVVVVDLKASGRENMRQNIKTHSGVYRGRGFWDKKLAGVANVSTLNHIFIATLIQPF